MEAAATTKFQPRREHHAHGALPAEPLLREQLAVLEFERVELFDEVDRQLFDLYRVAVEPVDIEPVDVTLAPVGALPYDYAPPIVPDIVVPRRIEQHAFVKLPRVRWLRAAALLSVLLVGFGLASFGTWTLVDFMRAQDTLTDQAAIDAVADRIIVAESGGDSSLKNKRSSATGAAQFIDETWLEMIRAYRPDLAKALSRKDTLELRHQPAISREIAMRFAERNAALLRRRGLPVTAGTIYLAHFAGGAGAVALLSAPAESDAATVMAKADASGKTKRDTVVKANPFLAQYTVADLKRWAERKMQRPRFFLTELLSANRKR